MIKIVSIFNNTNDSFKNFEEDDVEVSLTFPTELNKYCKPQFIFKDELNELIEITKKQLLFFEKENDDFAIIRLRKLLKELEKIKSENNSEEDKTIYINFFNKYFIN